MYINFKADIYLRDYKYIMLFIQLENIWKLAVGCFFFTFIMSFALLFLVVLTFYTFSTQLKGITGYYTQLVRVIQSFQFLSFSELFQLPVKYNGGDCVGGGRDIVIINSFSTCSHVRVWEGVRKVGGLLIMELKRWL